MDQQIIDIFFLSLLSVLIPLLMDVYYLESHSFLSLPHTLIFLILLLESVEG